MLLRDYKLKLPTPITAYILTITHFSHHFRNVTDINCGIVAKLFTLQSQKILILALHYISKIFHNRCYRSERELYFTTQASFFVH